MTTEQETEARSSLRKPPWSQEAEQSVLGGLLLDNSAWDRVGDLLMPADFFADQHRVVFETIGSILTACRPADVLTVFDLLESKGLLDRSGGMKYLNALVESVLSASNIRRYAEIVREKAMTRRLISAADEVATIGFQDGSIDDKMDRAASIFAALERGQTKKMPRTLGEIAIKRLDHITDLQEGTVQPGWPTILPSLNRMLNGGLRPGKVYILAARPSVGKSALAQAMGLALAKDHELPVLFLSQEMPEDELADRAISEMGGVDLGRLQTGKLQDIEWQGLTEAVETANRIPYYVDDQPALRLSDIRTKARSIKGLKVLVLDYLQLSEAQGEHSNRNGAVEEISKGLKRLSKELGIAVLVLSQLNRKVEERPNKRPILADLRDSGAIEQDADVVMFLFPIKELKAHGCWEIGLDIPKNRQGKKGAFALNFWGDHMRWGESEYRLEDLLKSSNTTQDKDWE